MSGGRPRGVAAPLPSERTPAAHSRTRLLLGRDFAFVWWGQLISQIGDGVTKLALLWFVYAITGSAMKTTIIGLLQTLPPILFGPIIGVYLDRLPKKPILIGTDLLRALVIGLVPCLLATASFTVAWLYVLVALDAMAASVFGPALAASVPSLVPRAQYTAANALLQSTTSVGIIVGPALSGLAIAHFSSQDVLCVNTVTYLVSAACFVPVVFAHHRVGQTAARRRWSVLQELVEGFQFTLVRQPIILLLIVTAAVHTAGTAAFSTLLPVFGRELFHLGPVEVGYFWSAFGVGLLIVSLFLVPLSAWRLATRVRIIALSSVLTAVALGALAQVEEPWTALPVMIVIGAGIGVFTPVAWGILQETAPVRVLGRALTIYTMGAMVAAILGMTVFGWITERFGPRDGVLGTGGMLGIAAIMAAAYGRRLRREG